MKIILFRISQLLIRIERNTLCYIYFFLFGIFKNKNHIFKLINLINVFPIYK